MKANLLILLTCALFISCGSDKGSPAGGPPQPIIGGNEFTADALAIRLEGARNLSADEARNFIQNNIAEITRVEIGMKWMETSQRLIQGSEADTYCYEKSQSEFEIIDVLPVGTNTDKPTIKLRVSDKITAIEGNNCREEIGKEVSYGPYEYEREDTSSGQTVDDAMEGFDQLQNPRVGTIEGRLAYSGSISFDGITYNFIDFGDQPDVYGTYVFHYQERFAGKVFQVVTKIVPMN